MAGRLRLNVSALAGDGVVGKFLVVVDEESDAVELRSKIDKSLRRLGLSVSCAAVLNDNKAELPPDERLGDMLRDGENIFAQLPVVQTTPRQPQPPQPGWVVVSATATPRPAGTSSGSRPASPRPASSSGICVAPLKIQAGGGDVGAGDGAAGGSVVALQPGEDSLRASITIPPEVFRKQVDALRNQAAQWQTQVAQISASAASAAAAAAAAAATEESEDEEATISRGRRTIRVDPPGPSEEFQVDTRRFPTEHFLVDHPTEPMQVDTYDNDWLVENFTPRFREYVLERFQGDLITEPKYVKALGKFVGSRFLQESGAFVSVFMRPQVTVGSDRNSTMPVHYNIPRGDIVAFQRKVEGCIDVAQQHTGLFRAALSRLTGLMAKGKAESEMIEVLMPHSYDVFQEVEGVMMEVERPLLPLGKTGGSNTVIVIDTAGGVGAHLTYVKAALKRALHAQMQTKATFQLLRFLPSTGEPRLWSKVMAHPNEEALQAAEDWVDRLTPAPAGNLLAAVYHALSHKECDEIFILSAGGCLSMQEQGKVLTDIRRLNVREVPIHTVAVNAEGHGELLLRNIAESNHGDFSSKNFDRSGGSTDMISSRDSRWTSWRTNLVNEKSRELTEKFKSHRMSIGSQIRIIEVMLREEARTEGGWRDEWQCAQRLLLSQEDEKARDVSGDAVRELERRSSRTMSARVGGGYMYLSGERDFGMEHLFEHKSAAPWTDASETTATGPRLPRADAGQARLPRLSMDGSATFPTLPSASGGIATFPSSSAAYPDRRPPTAPASIGASSGAGRAARPRSAAGGVAAGDGDRGGISAGGSTGSESPATAAGQLPPVTLTRGNSVLLAQHGQNPWNAPAPERTKRPPSGRKRGRGGSSARMASADRAAGSRASSPANRSSTSRSKGRSKTPPGSASRERKAPSRGLSASTAAAVVAAGPSGDEGPDPPDLERRWSY